MKAILIDVENKKFREVESNGLQDKYKHIGCNYVDCVGISDTTDVWVDDEGLLKGNLNGFRVNGYEGVLMGNGLVMDHDRAGECTDSSLTIAELQKIITFISYDAPELVPRPRVSFVSI